MIAEIHPDMDPGHLDQYFLERSILCPHNVDVDEFNTRLLDSFSGEERVYHSADFVMRMVKAYNTLQNIFNPLISLPSPHTDSS